MRTAAADWFERDAAHRDGARQSAMSRQNSWAEGSLREGARVSAARADDGNMTQDFREYARGVESSDGIGDAKPSTTDRHWSGEARDQKVWTEAQAAVKDSPGG